MGFSLSPSTTVNEVDLTNRIPAVSTTIVGTVGQFLWGPAFEKTQVTNERELIDTFNYPNDTVADHWHSAAEFLRYGSDLWVVRAVDPTTALNAGLEITDDSYGTVSGIATAYIPNFSNQPTITFGANGKLKIFARNPGALGNTNIKVAVCSATDFASADIISGTSFASEFEYIPQEHATYDYYDQLAIAVLWLDTYNNTWTIVEKWIVGLDPVEKDNYNKSTYIENIINNKSKYLYAYDDTTNLETPNSIEATFLLGGNDGTPAAGNIQVGYDEFDNAEEFDVSIIMDGGNNDAVTGAYIIDNIADVRKDCVAVLNVPEADVVGVATIATAIANCVTYRTTTLNKNSSYAELHANWKWAYDKFGEKYRWMPMSGDIAGLMVQSDENTDPWYPAAGLVRGQIKNVKKLAIQPNRTYRDTLYKNGINAIVGFPGQGSVLWGQKTLLDQPSAFDRINVRRLFIVLEKAISTMSKYMIFEFNDDTQRELFKLMVNPYLKNIQGRRGIYEYLVTCDETNNTPTVIDNNEFIGDIYIKPARSAEFVKLNFIAVATGVNFSEILLRD